MPLFLRAFAKNKRNARGSEASVCFFLLFLLFGFFNLMPAYAAPTGYYVPPAQFNAAFQIMDLGFSNIFGLFESAIGSFTFDAETKTISNLRLAIDMDSLVVPKTDAERELKDMLAVDDYGELTFMAATPATFKDGKTEIKGTLTTHGQSKEMTLEATLNNVEETPRNPNNPWTKSNGTVGLSLRGHFARADFAMGDKPEIPGRFGKDITLMLEMKAMQQ